MGKRKSFVGTPCWMAPEVITGKQYDASADIWSFGITALELTQGRAPHSRAAPSSVLMQVATAPPPKMDRNAGVHNYSAAFADIIEQCLQKDPAKRPTAQDLLNSSFFKGAKKKGYLVGAVLKNLPPLVQRQEKRRVPSLMTHATMDSWDFSIRGGEDAVGSPTTSVYSVHSHSRRPRSALPKDGLAELAERQPHLRRPQSTEPAHEEDAAAYARRIRERHRSGSRSHSRSVSWADSDDGSLPSAHQAHPAPIAEVDILSSSPRSSEGVPAPAAALADPDTKADAAQGYSAHEVDLNRLAAPRARRPSLSPTPSYSNASSSESNSVSTSTDPSEAVTPPQSVAAPSPGLWRRLVGRGEPKLGKGERERAGDREREREKEEGDAGFRRKALGGVSILAGRSAGLVRTVSRVGTGACAVRFPRCFGANCPRGLFQASDEVNPRAGSRSQAVARCVAAVCFVLCSMFVLYCNLVRVVVGALREDAVYEWTAESTCNSSHVLTVSASVLHLAHCNALVYSNPSMYVLATHNHMIPAFSFAPVSASPSLHPHAT